MTIDIHDLAAGYALDALEGEDLVAFEAHLQTCRACQEEVAGFSQTTQLLGASLSITPPPSLKAKLLDEIATTDQAPAETHADVIDLRSRFQKRVLVAAAAGLVLIAAFFGIATAIGDDEAEYAAILEANDAQEAKLEGDGEATFFVAWSPTTGEFALRGDNVPAVGDGKTYEFWFIGDGDPVNAGLFTADSGQVELSGVLPGAPVVWAITVEPAGGSPAPTSDIIYSVAL